MWNYEQIRLPNLTVTYSTSPIIIYIYHPKRILESERVFLYLIYHKSSALNGTDVYIKNTQKNNLQLSAGEE